MGNKIRAGIGYDVHPLVTNRKLILGGVEIPFEKGLEGWSDADAVTHAIIDALLGAAAMGDIGIHFPPGDLKFKGISSLELLKQTQEKLRKEKFLINNIDVTVIAEQPRLKNYINEMRKNLDRILEIGINNISIKASTCNGLGFIGKGEGIAACAVALIESES